MLLAGAAAALIWVNVDRSSYESVWNTNLSIRLGGASVSESLRLWVNNGLMTFFFFTVGLEARREFDLGELRDRRRVTLPMLAAVGGMAVPVGIYLALNAGRVVPHERLLAFVWGSHTLESDVDQLKVHVRHLREKLERNPSAPEYLVTVRGVGYKLAEPRREP